MNDPRIDRIAIIGLGLIGSSLALALRARNLAGEIVGHARSESTRSIALQRGFCDAVHAGVEETVEGAGLVVLATPVGAFVDLLTRAAPHLAPGAVVTDVAGVKGAVVRDLLPLIPEGRVLVPGHPIAGTEQSGPESGFVELFEDRWCVLTPQADTPKEALALVTSIWEGVGSRVEIMTPEHHDRVLAVTSHLPHAIAYTMVGIADDLASVTQGEVVQYSASGFRDFTRIAASDPVMWRDIFLANRDAVLEGLSRFTEELLALQRAIRWGYGDELEQKLRRGRDIRRGIVESGQDAEGSALYLSRRGLSDGDTGDG